MVSLTMVVQRLILHIYSDVKLSDVAIDNNSSASFVAQCSESHRGFRTCNMFYTYSWNKNQMFSIIEVG